MPEADPDTITRLLGEVSAGRPQARGTLLDQVYGQLRAIAQKRMAAERRDHTLQATALVHEAYMRLMPTDGGSEVAWRDRGHFYRAAAEAMRRILIEHARRKGAEKRGGDCTKLSLSVLDLADERHADEILSLDDALTRLGKMDATSEEIVRLRFFAGLTIEQVAAVLGVSDRTVKREWEYARARLYGLLEQER